MKGIEDLIKAVAIVKKQKSNIILCIIGRVSETYFNYLKDLIANLNLTANIVFRGFLPTQKELHEEVVKARISVLPTYNDTIPGTIVESMLLGIPVITYNVGGNPDINKYEENIILVDMGNVERLAYEITKLLSNTERQKELAYRARKYATYEFDNTNSVNELVKTYKKIIKQYNNIN